MIRVMSLPLSPLSCLAAQGEIGSVSGLPGLITLITLPVKVDHREKREERMGERRAECEQRSAVSAARPRVRPVATLPPSSGSHTHTPGAPTFQWPLTAVRGQVSAWVTHVAIAGPGRPGICHESENWSGPARAPT